MSLTIKQEKKEFKKIPVGNHMARCISVIDLGTQEETKFGTDELVKKHKVRVIWEFPNEQITWTDEETGEEKTKPMTKGKTYNASLNENSNLYKELVSWRGKEFTADELAGFQLKNILNAPCSINIVHKENEGKIYENITSISPVMKGVTCPDRISDKTLLDLDDFDKTAFDSLSEYWQDLIMKSEEMNTAKEAGLED